MIAVAPAAFWQQEDPTRLPCSGCGSRRIVYRGKKWVCLNCGMATVTLLTRAS